MRDLSSIIDPVSAFAAQPRSRRGRDDRTVAGETGRRQGKQSAPPKPQNVLSPDAALERLQKGNARYVEGVSLRHDFKHEREALAGGQNPYAAILSCADSRIAPEYAFDSGRGDLFVCRVAGNFANERDDRQP